MSVIVQNRINITVLSIQFHKTDVAINWRCKILCIKGNKKNCYWLKHDVSVGSCGETETTAVIWTERI